MPQSPRGERLKGQGEPWNRKWPAPSGWSEQQVHGLARVAGRAAKRVGLLVLLDGATKTHSSGWSKVKSPHVAQHRGRGHEVPERMGWRMKVEQVFVER